MFSLPAQLRRKSVYVIGLWLASAVLGAGVALAQAVAPPEARPAGPHARTDSTAVVTWSTPITLDFAQAEAGLGAFLGSFAVGRYGYYAPMNGRAARVDLANFTPGGVITLDLHNPSWGGFSDGRYAYFVSASSGPLDRVDLQNFSPSGVVTLDVKLVDNHLQGFWGGFTDGRYGYLVPNIITGGPLSGMVGRVDLQNFSLGGVVTLDLTLVDDSLNAFSGGFSDGRYAYFVPSRYDAHGARLARVDLQNFSPGGVVTVDVSFGSGNGYHGGFTDGRYAYLSPYSKGDNVTYSGKIARVDLQHFDASGVSSLDLTSVDSSLKGFWGGFSDGRYGYFVPNGGLAGTPSGKVVRVDLRNFNTSGVSVLDLAATDPRLKTFGSGFSDGRYAYFAPMANHMAARLELPPWPFHLFLPATMR